LSAPARLPGWARLDGGRLILEIQVQPRAGRDRIGGVHDGALRVRTTAPPVDDAANRRVAELLGSALGVPRRAVTVVSGHRSRRKRVAVDGGAQIALARLEALAAG